MIVGFLGKGGSGKTTLATLFTKYLLSKNRSVLAIDADHNMDFSYNLGARENVPFFGRSISEIKSFVGLSPNQHFREIYLGTPAETFALFPHDEFTNNYTYKVKDNFHVMVAGPHTEEILEGDKCSHSLFTSLKVYLPNLELKDNQFVVVDEKAGMDPVGTIVPAGFDLAVIVSEPTIHSTKTANQISQGLESYGTPYVFVGNKVLNKEQEDFLNNHLYKKPLCIFTHDISKLDLSDYNPTEEEAANLNLIEKHALSINTKMKDRQKRSFDIFTRSFFRKNQ